MFAMSPAEEAAPILQASWASTRRRRAGQPLADRRQRDREGRGRRSRRTSRRCERAQEAFLQWRTVPAPRRGELVRLLGEELRAAKEPLARLVTLEAGKIVQEGLGEVQEMIDICDFAVGLSRQLYGLTIASERPNHRMIEQWHPLGPVLVISAFNFPVAVWAWNAALALVCGDPVIWKPSEKTPLMRRGGDGAGGARAGAVRRCAGRAAAMRPGRARGRRGAGRRSAHRAGVGDRIDRDGPRGRARAWRSGSAASLLELGGNNAMIVAPVADLDAGRAGDPVLGGGHGRAALHDAAPADRP